MIGVADVRAARARLAGIIAETPCPYSETLSEMTGARVHIKLENLQMTGAFKEIEAERGLVFVHPFDDARVIAGQGTIGLELLEQVPDLDAVLVPVGRGGLIGGISTAIKVARPGVKVIGVRRGRSRPCRRHWPAIPGSACRPPPRSRTASPCAAWANRRWRSPDITWTPW